MPSISNSFHTSSKKNAIRSLTNLKKAQKHNEREYLSTEFSSSRIDVLRGTSNLYQDTIDYIDREFAPYIAAYNDKQKRNDRKINVSASDYFDQRKDTDVANEVIFQFGDFDWWSERRQAIELKNGMTIYQFDPEIKQIATNIFMRQAEAYENIYVEHGKEIKEKIQNRFDECEMIIDQIGSENPSFDKIIEEKNKGKRSKMFNALTTEEKEKCREYQRALSDRETIKKKNLIENIETYKIDITNLTLHHDEHSLHAHAISVCSAGGFKKGLERNINKSNVLNRWALEVLQDKMRSILQEEMDLHPEIFQDTELKEKQKGRNRDYTKDEYVARKVAEREDRLQELTEHVEQLKDEVQVYQDLKVNIDEVNTQTKDLPFGNVAIKREDLELLKEQAKAYVVNKDEIQTLRERIEKVKKENAENMRIYMSMHEARKEIAFKKGELDQEIKKYKDLYQEQIKINIKVNELKKDVEFYRNMTNQLTDANADLKAQLSTLRAEADQKVQVAVQEAKKPLEAKIETLEHDNSKLKEKAETFRRVIDDMVGYITSIIKAVRMLKYDPERGYKVEHLTQKQERLIDGIASFGIKIMNNLGMKTAARNIDKTIGITPSIQEYIDPPKMLNQEAEPKKKKKKDDLVL